MSSSAIVIERRLPEALRAAAAEIYDEAFGDKLRMAVPDRARRRAFMGRVINGSHSVVAVRGDELLGVVGLSARSGPYRGGFMDVGWDPRPHRDLLGWWGALRAVWGTSLADHRPRRDELYVDGIAVSAAARGQGIGTRLLEEVATIAREGGMRWVRLDVIDTNPRAQALYERVGYRVTGVQSFRFLSRWVGFGALVSMELPVAGGGSPGSRGGRTDGARGAR